MMMESCCNSYQVIMQIISLSLSLYPGQNCEYKILLYLSLSLSLSIYLSPFLLHISDFFLRSDGCCVQPTIEKKTDPDPIVNKPGTGSYYKKPVPV